MNPQGEECVMTFKNQMCYNQPWLKSIAKAKGNLMLHPLPSIEELYVKLSGAKIFSVFDLTIGYYHIKLGKDSHAKTIFVTPFGK